MVQHALTWVRSPFGLLGRMCIGIVRAIEDTNYLTLENPTLTSHMRKRNIYITSKSCMCIQVCAFTLKASFERALFEGIEVSS